MHDVSDGGLLIALATGLGSLALGHPFLTTHTAHVHWPLVGEVWALGVLEVIDLFVEDWEPPAADADDEAWYDGCLRAIAALTASKATAAGSAPATRSDAAALPAAPNGSTANSTMPVVECVIAFISERRRTSRRLLAR